MNFGSGNCHSLERYQAELWQAKSGSSFTLRLGLPQWGEKMWKGAFYPEDLREKEFLSFYSKVLDCVEVSSTFYAPVSKERMADWASQVGDSFRFIVKWPRSITHDRGLVHCSDLTSSFIESLEGLEHRCGSTLLQLPPSFSRSSHRELYYFLISLPKDLPIALEFRHASWFDNGTLYQKLFDFLQKNHIGMTVSDTPQAQDVFHQSFSGNTNILRYLSDGNREHDQKRLQYWKEQLQLKRPGKEFYLVFHQENNLSTPELIEFFDSKWSEELKLHHQSQQQSLF
jgi:uncharacterized protein YecE (DUF72 family)